MGTRGLKADVTEAWKRRKKKRWTLQAGTSAQHRRNFRPDAVKTEDASTTELWPELPPLMAGTSALDRNFRPGRPELPPHRTSASYQPTLACNLPLHPLAYK